VEQLRLGQVARAAVARAAMAIKLEQMERPTQAVAAAVLAIQKLAWAVTADRE
jgi:hypothetical protein